MPADLGCRRGFVHSLVIAVLSASLPLAQTAGEEFHERWRWAHFTTVDGLPSNHIEQLIDLGDTTYAGTDVGLARYDGWRWTHLGAKSGLPEERVLSLVAAPDDSIWVSTPSGLFTGDGRAFERVALPAPYDKRTVVASAHSVQGDVFVSVDLKDEARTVVLHRRGTDAFAPIDLNAAPGYATNHPTLAQVAPGRVWLGVGSAYSTWEEEGWVERFRTSADSFSSCQGLWENAAGEGLLGVREPIRYRGVYAWTPDYELTRLDAEGRGIVAGIAIGPEGEAAILYDTYELRYRADGVWTELLPLPDEFTGVTSMRFRANGDLWVGTEHGLHLLRRRVQRWTRLYHRGFNDQRNRVNEILVDRNENTWIGNTVGVEVRDASLQLLDIALPVETVVTGIGEDEDGIVWVSSGSALNGLYGWDGEQWLRVERDTLGGPLGVIHKIRRDNSNGLWLLVLASGVGSAEDETGGVYQLVGGAAVAWRPGDELLNRRVYDMLEDKRGALWFATSRGVSRFDDAGWTHWDGDDGLTHPSVFRIRPRDDGGVWMAHPYSGLGWLVPNADSAAVGYVDLGSAASNNVWDFAPDGEHLWITTASGLHCLHGDGSVSRFEQMSGLRSPKAWPVLPRSDHVFVGTMGGGTFLLDRIGEHTPKPRVYIERLREKDGSPLVRWNVASFWGDQPPLDVQTRYRVDGGAWSAYSTKHEIHLDKIKPGTHSFDVQARGLFGGDGDVASTRVDVRVPVIRRVEFILPMAALTGLLLLMASSQYARRRKDAAALRQSEADYRTLMEHASDAILVADRFGILRAMNTRARELFGPSEHLVGRPMNALVDPSDAAGRLALSAAFATESPRVVSARLRRRDGEALNVEASIKRIDTDRVLAIVRDLSERLRLEEERRELERQIMESQKLESLGQLAGGLAHDFNNLLMLVLGHADQARHVIEDARSPASEAVQSLEEVVRAAERAGEMTQKLLAFAGREAIEHVSLDVSALVRDLDELLQATVPRDARLTLDLAQDLPLVEAAPARLRQVLMNLVINARDALEGGSGEITVRTSRVTSGELPEFDVQLDDLDRDRNAVMIEVIDTGTGMSDSTRKRMFEPFFSSRFQGRGLGLAAVRGIVRSHRGAIHVVSKAGEGTTVRVVLPTAAYTLPAARPAHPLGMGTGTRVLVIDDDAGVRHVVANMLERVGYPTLVASSGAEGVELFRKERMTIACTIVDLTMPGLDGLATRAALQAIDSSAAVLLMSGYSEEVSREGSDGSGIFLQKPFSARELVEAVRTALGVADGVPASDG